MPRIKKALVETKKKKIEPTVKEERIIPTEVVVEEPQELDIDTLIINDKSNRYFEASGRRKTSVARVRLFTKGDKVFTINDKPFDQYFSTIELQSIAKSPLEKMKCFDKFRILTKVSGGGIHSQAEAVRHGISRALVAFNQDFKKRLKRAGFLTRDSRMRERKKFGLKRARKAPQWSKR